MAHTEDLIDFNVIEEQKENIEALPSGRSAKALAQRFSPVSVVSPSESHDINTTARNAFEQEIGNIGDSDDPLDVYDRYIRWTQNTYPSNAGQSQLLPLLERTTKAFLKDENYKNDARYLKIWLQYIRLFSDAPRETFAYLARHSIGGGLALYYEEFAAWLEQAGRFQQAEEIYKLGIEREARPTERLLRKFGEFESRAQSRPATTQEPSSPALPAVRAALVTKTDPFSLASPASADPQAVDRGRATTNAAKKQKMQIFSDDGAPAQTAPGGQANGWENLGTTAERRKENTIAAQSWNGEKMGLGSKQAPVPKMTIFKDQSSRSMPNQSERAKPPSTTASVPKKVERVFVNLELVYPNRDNPAEEYCFEELRAASRGWLQRNWREDGGHAATRLSRSRPKMPAKESTTTLVPLAGGETSDEERSSRGMQGKLALGDENNPSLSASTDEQEAAKRFRREERANKTRRIQMKEAKAETQTIQANLDSPRGPKLRRKKSVEPTMTINTRAATDEVYELFNQSLSESEEHSEEGSSDESSDDDEDGYTTGGESTGTGTGHISGTTSEIGEATKREIECDDDAPDESVRVEETQDNTGWSEFTTSKHMPRDGIDDDPSGHSSQQNTTSDHFSRSSSHDLPREPRDDTLDVVCSPKNEEELVTPTSPSLPAQTGTHRFVPIPPEDYRAPTRPYRDASQVAANRLPFMTPIVENTESSLGTMTRTPKDYFSSKTPCPKASQKTPIIAEDDDELLSSPFQEHVALRETSKHNIQSPDPVSRTKPKVTTAPFFRAKDVVRGPIIRDSQCNPMSPEVHEVILREMQPPLSTFEGFFDRRGTVSSRKPDIHKYCKSVSASKAKYANDKTISTLTLPPMLALEGAQQQYAIKRELGAGAFAPIYLAEALSASDASDHEEEDEGQALTRCRQHDLHRPGLQALKMEDPPSAWEFYMLRCAHRRLGLTRPANSIVQAYEMHLFDDEGYLLEDYCDQGTLLDLVNTVADQNRQNGTQSAGMDECLAMFFTIEILRTVEALHAKNIIHGDLKADNILIRFQPPETNAELSSQYARDGTSGWSAKGITLIDFGRGIDMRHFNPNAQFIADWATSETDCAEMRELRPWTYQADYHGIAAIAHTMLFGRYIETVAEKGGIGAGASKTYRLKEGLKRWWQTDIWHDFFTLLLNPTRHLEKEAEQKMPVLKGLKDVREGMERWLEANSEKGVGLRTWIRRSETTLAAKRRG